MASSRNDRGTLLDADDGLSSQSFSELAAALEDRKHRSSATVASVDFSAADEPTPTDATSAPGDPDSTSTGTAGGFGDLAEVIADRRSRDGWKWVDPEPELNGWPASEFSDAKAAALVELLDTASSVLVSGPLGCPSENDACTKLFAPDPVRPTNALLVTFAQSPDERLNICRGYLGDLPDETVVLNVGDYVRSAATAASSTVHYDGVAVETLTDPTDLARLGMTISKYLAEWERANVRSVVCVHSLTTLLQFVDDVQTVFRFLHVLQGRVEATGASAHYHIDSEAHDERVLATLRPLFDAVLAYSEDGSLSIR